MASLHTRRFEKISSKKGNVSIRFYASLRIPKRYHIIQTLTTNQEKSLFLLRSWYEQGPSGGECERSGQRGSRLDHQGKVSVFATRRSSTRGNYQGGPGSAARVGVVRASPQTPRPMPRCARASAAPKGSPDWPSAGPTSAGWRNASLRLIAKAARQHESRTTRKS
jgi:hypothetical protein